MPCPFTAAGRMFSLFALRSFYITLRYAIIMSQNGGRYNYCHNCTCEYRFHRRLAFEVFIIGANIRIRILTNTS